MNFDTPTIIALLSDGKILYPFLYFLSPLPFNLGNFKQHITCSTVTGIAVGGIAYHFGMPPSACLVSAGLCSFAGMLPDIDSDTSKSFQECIYLTAGIGCILTAARLRNHVDPDLAMLGGAFIFLLIRFGLAPLIKKITVHRGMIHSIPMAILCGQLVFFVVTGTVVERLVKAAALTIGFLSHLILDEVFSIDSTGATLRLKRSFGTALKWTNPKRPGSVMVIYSLVFIFGFAACLNPDVIEQLGGGVSIADQTAPADTSHLRGFVEGWLTAGSTNKNAQSLQSEIQREAVEFLSQQKATSPATPPAASELPSAMQIGTDWNRNLPMQPARIVLP